MPSSKPRKSGSATFPPFRAGDTLRVNVRVKEGEKERIQAFEGVCIARRGSGVSETFTVRKISNGVGVERIFPVHSPMLAEINVVRRGRVRRAKLYYLRNLTGKATRIKREEGARRGAGDAAPPVAARRSAARQRACAIAGSRSSGSSASTRRAADRRSRRSRTGPPRGPRRRMRRRHAARRARHPPASTTPSSSRAAERERLAAKIRERARRASAIGAASVREIDRVNIYHATVLAMRRALGAARASTPHHVLIDGKPIRTLGVEHTAIVGGDDALLLDRLRVDHRQGHARPRSCARSPDAIRTIAGSGTSATPRWRTSRDWQRTASRRITAGRSFRSAALARLSDRSSRSSGGHWRAGGAGRPQSDARGNGSPRRSDGFGRVLAVRGRASPRLRICIPAPCTIPCAAVHSRCSRVASRASWCPLPTRKCDHLVAMRRVKTPVSVPSQVALVTTRALVACSRLSCAFTQLFASFSPCTTRKSNNATLTSTGFTAGPPAPRDRDQRHSRLKTPRSAAASPTRRPANRSRKRASS